MPASGSDVAEDVRTMYIKTVYSCISTIKFKRKTNPYFGMGKKSKVMPQCPAIYLFPWEREGNLQSLL